LRPIIMALRDALHSVRREVSFDGDPDTLAAVLNEKFPDLSLPFIRAGLENYWKILDALRRAGHLDTVRNGLKRAYIPNNAAEPYRDKLLKMLN